jgi:predicted ATP-grasp superfamily ATP-dependent carboligase
MKVFVFEYLCSGSATGDDVSPHLVPMGNAMLQAAVADMLALGMEVTTLLDHRISMEMGSANVVRVTSAAQSRIAFETLSTQADATLVIAPESDGVLESWIDRLEARGCRTFNSTLAATNLCSDKLRAVAFLQQAGLPAPETQQFDGHVNFQYPVVVKPRQGAGSEWTFVCYAPADLKNIPQWTDWIIQPLCKGVAASCSLIVRDGKATPLLVGLQHLEGVRRLHYRGGSLPYNSPRAAELARRAAEAVPGLAGFIGVDMILGDDPSGREDYILEINPRITMSYLGLRQICEQNLLDAVIGRIDPASLTWKTGTLRFNSRGEMTWENRS